MASGRRTAPLVGLSNTALGSIVATRFFLNTVFRVTYPLLTVVVTRLHISEQRVAGLVTVQVLFGLLGPISGTMADRWGYRRLMALGLSLTVVGCLVLAAAHTFLMLLVGFGIVGSGTSLYQPAMQAFVSAQTPVERRGRILGIVELSWALSLIAGVPVFIRLLERTGSWTTGFALLAGLLFLFLVSVRLLPAEAHHHAATTVSRPLRSVVSEPHVWGMLLFLWLVFCGGETLFVVQTVWIPVRFGVGSGAVALALSVFGAGELGGSSLATLFTDRIGVRRAPLVGYTLAAILFFLLPIASVNWYMYLLLFAVYAVAFEFAIVASISLASTIDPRARGLVLALAAMAITLGRAAGSQVGVLVRGVAGPGILMNGIVAAVLVLIGVGLGYVLVHPQEQRVVNAQL